MDAEALMARLSQTRERLMRARRAVERQRWEAALEDIAQASRDMDEVRALAVRGAQEAGLSDSEIARRLGVTQPAISKGFPRPDRRRRQRRGGAEPQKPPGTQPPEEG
jgi:hypothetical protein